jgi:hypothetical protein
MFKDRLWNHVDVFAGDRNFMRLRQGAEVIESSKFTSMRRWSRITHNNLPGRVQNSEILVRALVGAGASFDDLLRLVPRKKQI